MFDECTAWRAGRSHSSGIFFVTICWKLQTLSCALQFRAAMEVGGFAVSGCLRCSSCNKTSVELEGRQPCGYSCVPNGVAGNPAIRIGVERFTPYHFFPVCHPTGDTCICMLLDKTGSPIQVVPVYL